MGREDVFAERGVEVIGEFFLLVQELLDRLVEDCLVEQARHSRDLSGGLIADVATVAELAEVVFGDTGDLGKHVVGGVVIEVRQDRVAVAVRHENIGMVLANPRR